MTEVAQVEVAREGHHLEQSLIETQPVRQLSQLPESRSAIWEIVNGLVQGTAATGLPFTYTTTQ